MQYRPNPQILPYKGRGVKFKASLLLGERFGERSKCIASIRELLYIDGLGVQLGIRFDFGIYLRGARSAIVHP